MLNLLISKKKLGKTLLTGYFTIGFKLEKILGVYIIILS